MPIFVTDQHLDATPGVTIPFGKRDGRAQSLSFAGIGVRHSAARPARFSIRLRAAPRRIADDSWVASMRSEPLRKNVSTARLVPRRLAPEARRRQRPLRNRRSSRSCIHQSSGRGNQLEGNALACGCSSRRSMVRLRPGAQRRSIPSHPERPAGSKEAYRPIVGPPRFRGGRPRLFPAWLTASALASSIRGRGQIRSARQRRHEA